MDLHGKTVLLTGATTGIGEATAHLLARDGATLLLHGPEPGEDVADVLAAIDHEGPGRTDYLSADFTRLAAVGELAEKAAGLTDRIDILINNAGVPGLPEQTVTEDGFERTFQVNYLAMAALTARLASLLHPGSRILHVGSATHYGESLEFDDLNLGPTYEATHAYAHSKLAVVTYSQWLADALGDTGPTVITVCPGLHHTALIDEMYGAVGGPVADGAHNLRHAATTDLSHGTYIQDGQIQHAAEEALDPTCQTTLVQFTENELQLPLYP